MSTPRRKAKDKEGLFGKRVLLIVTGGIAAYKSALLTRLLVRSGAEVRVVMTEAAKRFVTPLTFEVLSGNPVADDLFAPHTEPEIEHIELSVWAERIVVAPATADFIAKSALGIADDLASTTIVSSRCPVYFAPAMNQAMWRSPTTKRNIETLKRDGRFVIEPGSGDLACGEEGPGRMAEPGEIVDVIESSFGRGELQGIRVLVTGGRTEEEIDPVRYISNRSSGKTAFAIAAEAKRRGAVVELIHGPVDVPPPDVDAAREVRSAAHMARAVKRAFPKADILIMAAAVADFTPERKSRGKMKRGEEVVSIRLKPTTDILASLNKSDKTKVVVGFALEDEESDRKAMEKLKTKGCDYLVFNRIGPDTGFSTDTNSVVIYGRRGRIASTPIVSKREIASVILDVLVKDKRIRQKSNERK